MSFKLILESLFKFILGVILIGLLIFIPAGTIYFYNGWIFMIILFIPILIAGIIMMIKNPELLKKRLDGKEKIKKQNIIIKLSGLMFIIGFIIAGLDFRFGWLVLPPWISYIACVIFICAYIMWGVVLKQNTYLSRTIKVVEGQTVVDTGLYGIVRHPMYTATLLLFMSMPLILGSLFAFFVFLLYPLLIIVRIKEEEKFLAKELKGYNEYKEKVKYRLIPFIW